MYCPPAVLGCCEPCSGYVLVCSKRATNTVRRFAGLPSPEYMLMGYRELVLAGAGVVGAGLWCLLGVWWCLAGAEYSKQVSRGNSIRVS